LQVLGLVRDLPPSLHGTRRWGLLAREHLHERRLACGVGSDDADDLAFPETARMDGELEVLEPLREFTERDERLGLPVTSGRAGVEADLAIPEADVLLLQVAAEVHVDRGAVRPRLCDDLVCRLLVEKKKVRVREQIKDGQVLPHSDYVLLLRQRLDDYRALT